MIYWFLYIFVYFSLVLPYYAVKKVYAVWFFFCLNSAALQFNFLFKFLGNKILPRILPCQIFHLP